MITSLTIDGFKSIIFQNIPLAGLNILTGLNSCGKSSVIQAIRILGRYDYGEKDVFLSGHGSLSELKNEASKSIDLNSCIQINGEERIVNFQTEPQYVFPKIIYISASRYGAQVSIPFFYDNHELGPLGENVLRCIDFYNDENLLQMPSSLADSDDEIKSFRPLVQYWLKAISPNVKFDYQKVKEMDASFSTFNGHRATNVGFGLSYTLPVIVAILMGVIEKNSIVLLENPEAHVHPKGQTKLAELICRAVNVGAQIVVETHSDHFFDGVRIYAKQHKGFAQNVRPYWFRLDDQNVTQVTSLTLFDDGSLNQWPEDMFDQFLINSEALL